MKLLNLKEVSLDFGKVLGSQLLTLMIIISLGVFGSSDLLADHAHEHDHHHRHQTVLSAMSLSAQARELQREHRFDEAAVMLARHLKSNPDDLEANLLHADVLTHSGKTREARGSCVRVALSGSPVLAKLCAVQVLLAEGDYQQADTLSQTVLADVSVLENSAQIWALEISAEAAWRAGRAGAAKELFMQLRARDNLPHSVMDTYQAFLHSQRSGQEAE